MNLLKKYIFLASWGLLGCNAPQADFSKKMPPLIDGKINPTEWTDSKTIAVEDKYELLLREDQHYFYIAVKNKTELPFYVDMFFLLGDSLFNIHSSSQLGQRNLTGLEWDDRTPITKWGYLENWMANTVLFDRHLFKKLREESYEGNISLATVIPYDGFEFQFSKIKWNLNGSAMRIEMRNMVGLEDFEETIFPKISERDDFEKWQKLEFEK